MPGLGHRAYCTPKYKCGIEEGDCDTNFDCKKGLKCGKDNCPETSKFESTDDCCEGMKCSVHSFLYKNCALNFLILSVKHCLILFLLGICSHHTISK